MGGGVCGVLDVAVTLGFVFQAVASRCVFVTSLSSKADFGGWVSAQNVSEPFQTCGVVQILLKLT